MSSGERRTSWVCGGTRGIGLAIARGCLARGDRTFVTGRTLSDSKSQERVGRAARVLRGDLKDESVVREQIEEIAAVVTRLDAVFVLAHDKFETCDPGCLEWGEFVAQFEGCLRPVLNVVSIARERRLLCAGSAIVIASSVSVQIGGDRMIPRSVAKGGVEALIRSLAHVYGPEGIRINGLSVGWTRTDQLDAFERSEGPVNTDGIPLRRVASAEEIAESALYLGSGASTYMTGTILPVAGGLGVVAR